METNNELVKVALTSSGLESVLSRLTDRLNDLESFNRAQEHRLEALKQQPPEVAESKKHLCETSAILDLSAKRPEQQLAAMADAIVGISHNVNQFYKDVKYREAMQQATDAAQDELMHMELDRLSRVVDVKFTRKDAQDMRKMIAKEMHAVREEMESEFAGKLGTVYDEVSGQLSRVADQMRGIQDTTSATNELLKYRIEEAFSDIQIASMDMDAKMRKITDIFGLSADPNGNETPSFPDMLKSMGDLQNLVSDCRDNLDFQTEKSSQLSRRIEEIEEAVGEQIGTLTEALKGEFGQSMSKMVSDLESELGERQRRVSQKKGKEKEKEQ